MEMMGRRNLRMNSASGAAADTVAFDRRRILTRSNNLRPASAINGPGVFTAARPGSSMVPLINVE
eukprot:15473497-Alexandrium_andersonii.AAC.1